MAAYFDKQVLNNVQTWLGAETNLQGRLKFSSNMRISGRFQGEIETSGFLYIEHGAEIEANIRAQNVIIAGVVRGNIHAEGVVEMHERSAVYGNIRSTTLRIADSVIFEGRCEMIDKAETIDIFSMPLQEHREEIQKKQAQKNTLSS